MTYIIDVLNASNLDNQSCFHDKTYFNKIINLTSGQLYDSITDKADILNTELESAFTHETPLRLSRMTQMKVQVFIDTGKLTIPFITTGCV